MITESCCFASSYLNSPHAIQTSNRGRVQVKGKREDIGLFECFSGDPADLRQPKADLLSGYHQALEHYFERRFPEAAVAFQALTGAHPADPVLQMYLKKARHLAEHGAPEGWTGVEAMDFK